MPRIPRQKSESGIYHIMLRGINQQIIFEDDEDYTKFITVWGRGNFCTKLLINI